MHTYYNDFFERGQQIINFNLYKIGLPSHDAVFTLKKVMEEMNFSNLTSRYSKFGRRGYNPIMIFAVIIYANLRGVKAIDRIVELCERDVCFMWLTKGEKPQRDVFYDFINNKLTEEVLDDLHYQFIRKLKKDGLISLEALFIDGTKIEANANRYTFVWRGSINYHLAGLLDKIDEAFKSYNELITKNGYDEKYSLSYAEMFIIEGMDKVKEVILKNRERKINNKKKISNNRIIEIDNISPFKLLDLQDKLLKIMYGETILFKTGKGQKKSEIQKLYEEIDSLGERLLKYKNSFEIMNSGRNSYSKTDLESTFMRMKDDHMRNGQLKPAYNVQVAVENYFVIHGYVSSDRTDYAPLIPVLEKHNKNLGYFPDEVTADSGYSSEKNLLYLSERNIESYIKLQTHEKMKTRAYKNDIGKYYNMKKEHDFYICHDGRKLTLERTEVSKSKGFERKINVYLSKDCSNCTYKSDCLYKYNEIKDKEKNKTMKVNERWDLLKEESHKNIQSEKGILNRQIRSIQTEGCFGDMKENNNFRRFNYRSSKKVYKELMLYMFGKNIGKYHKFIYGEIQKFEGKADQISA